MRGLFITGTDTGVGKTYLAAALARRLREEGERVGAYKPAVSGREDSATWPVWADVEALHQALGGEFSRDVIAPQRFLAPLAPPVAARLEGRTVDASRLRQGAADWRDKADVLIVEGAGGLLCPLTETETVADLALDLGFPLIVVARLNLGTINHTLLTLEAARLRGMVVAGVVLNEAVPTESGDLSGQTNPDELSRRTGIPILGIFPHAPAGGLLQLPAFRRIDWKSLARHGRV